MRFIVFVTLIIATLGAQQKVASIQEFLTGEWKVFEAAPKKVENPVGTVEEEVAEIPQAQDTDTAEPTENVESETPKEEVVEEKKDEKPVPIFSFNITKRTDVENILDLMMAKKEEAKEEAQQQEEKTEQAEQTEEQEEKKDDYYQVIMTDETTAEVVLVGESEENDKTLATLGFSNATGIYVAEGQYENLSYTITIPRTNALMMTITTQSKDEAGNLVIKNYIATKAPVDNRTFFQKYQMFIMMGVMMLMQTMTAPQMGQQQGAPAPAQ